ncbi:MAG: hypothetical protein ACRYGI_11590 [Janthinobacterium lividum]
MTDTDALVARLTAMYSHRGDGIPTQCVNPDGAEAADLIARQAEEIARLEAALERIADVRNTHFAGDARVVAQMALGRMERIMTDVCDVVDDFAALTRKDQV